MKMSPISTRSQLHFHNFTFEVKVKLLNAIISQPRREFLSGKLYGLVISSSIFNMYETISWFFGIASSMFNAQHLEVEEAFLRSLESNLIFLSPMCNFTLLEFEFCVRILWGVCTLLVESNGPLLLRLLWSLQCFSLQDLTFIPKLFCLLMRWQGR